MKKWFTLVLIVAVGILLTVMGWSVRAQSSSRVTWEYQVISSYGPSSTNPPPNVHQRTRLSKAMGVGDNQFWRVPARRYSVQNRLLLNVLSEPDHFYFVFSAPLSMSPSPPIHDAISGAQAGHPLPADRASEP